MVNHGFPIKNEEVSHTLSIIFPIVKHILGNMGGMNREKSSCALYCDESMTNELRAPTSVSGVQQAAGGVEGQVDLDG